MESWICTRLAILDSCSWTSASHLSNVAEPLLGMTIASRVNADQKIVGANIRDGDCIDFVVFFVL